MPLCSTARRSSGPTTHTPVAYRSSREPTHAPLSPPPPSASPRPLAQSSAALPRRPPLWPRLWLQACRRSPLCSRLRRPGCRRLLLSSTRHPRPLRPLRQCSRTMCMTPHACPRARQSTRQTRVPASTAGRPPPHLLPPPRRKGPPKSRGPRGPRRRTSGGPAAPLFLPLLSYSSRTRLRVRTRRLSSSGAKAVCPCRPLLPCSSRGRRPRPPSGAPAWRLCPPLPLLSSSQPSGHRPRHRLPLSRRPLRLWQHRCRRSWPRSRQPTAAATITTIQSRMLQAHRITTASHTAITAAAMPMRFRPRLRLPRCSR